MIRRHPVLEPLCVEGLLELADRLRIPLSIHRGSDVTLERTDGLRADNAIDADRPGDAVQPCLERTLGVRAVLAINGEGRFGTSSVEPLLERSDRRRLELAVHHKRKNRLGGAVLSTCARSSRSARLSSGSGAEGSISTSSPVLGIVTQLMSVTFDGSRGVRVT